MNKLKNLIEKALAPTIVVTLIFFSIIIFSAWTIL